MVRRHPRTGLRDKWTAAVLASPATTPTKLTLVAMACRMGDHGVLDLPYERNKGPRQQLAELFGVHPQRIAERLAEARKLGLLDLIEGSGQRGRPARYVAVLPSVDTAERYAWERFVTGQRYALSGTHSPVESDHCVPDSGTHNARASVDEPQQPDVTGGTDRVSPLHLIAERRSNERDSA